MRVQYAGGAGIGKIREADSGDVGFTPLENMGQQVLSDCSQDAFAMGVVMDAVFLKNEGEVYNIFFVSLFSIPMCDEPSHCFRSSPSSVP